MLLGAWKMFPNVFQGYLSNFNVTQAENVIWIPFENERLVTAIKSLKFSLSWNSLLVYDIFCIKKTKSKSSFVWKRLYIESLSVVPGMSTVFLWLWLLHHIKKTLQNVNMTGYGTKKNRDVINSTKKSLKGVGFIFMSCSISISF